MFQSAKQTDNGTEGFLQAKAQAKKCWQGGEGGAIIAVEDYFFPIYADKQPREGGAIIAVEADINARKTLVLIG